MLLNLELVVSAMDERQRPENRVVDVETVPQFTSKSDLQNLLT